MIFHVAGNAVFDLRLHQELAGGSGAGDRWTPDNVLFAGQPPTPILGGCGAAPAYALGRLVHGLHPVYLNTHLGADLFGGLLHNWLVHAGVEMLRPPEPHTLTSTHVIQADGAGRRSLFYRGRRVDWARSFDAPHPDWFLAGGHGLVDASDAAALGAVCQGLREGGTQIVVDPGPWFAQRVTAPQMAPLWSHVDVLTGTADELRPYLPESAPGADVDLAPALLGLGIGAAVVKLGTGGASWASAEGSGRAAAPPVDSGYTVGAGDTFNARLLFGLSRGDALADATRAAVALATRAAAGGRGVMGAFDDVPMVEGLAAGP